MPLSLSGTRLLKGNGRLSSMSGQVSCSACYRPDADSCKGSRGLNALGPANVDRGTQGAEHLFAMLPLTSPLDHVPAEPVVSQGQVVQQ